MLVKFIRIKIYTIQYKQMKVARREVGTTKMRKSNNHHSDYTDGNILRRGYTEICYIMRNSPDVKSVFKNNGKSR